MSDSEPREKKMTREDIEMMLYQFDSSNRAIVSLLMDISDKLDTLIEQTQDVRHDNANTGARTILL